MVSSLFKLDLSEVLPQVGVRAVNDEAPESIDVNALRADIDAIIVAVDRCNPGGPAEIVKFLRREGRRKVPAKSSVGSYLVQKAYKHLFHKENGIWELITAGKRKLQALLAPTEVPQ